MDRERETVGRLEESIYEAKGGFCERERVKPSKPHLVTYQVTLWYT